MGYGGNTEPSFLIPTAVAAADEGAVDAGSGRPGGKEGISDMEYLVGDDAVATKMFQTNYPIRHGLIENWNNMERLWQRCFYEYMRVEPDEHYVLLVRAVLFHRAALVVPTLDSLDSPVVADGAPTQPPREPRVHCRGHVRDVQRPGPVHRGAGCPCTRSVVAQPVRARAGRGRVTVHLVAIAAASSAAGRRQTGSSPVQ